MEGMPMPFPPFMPIPGMPWPPMPPFPPVPPPMPPPMPSGMPPVQVHVTSNNHPIAAAAAAAATAAINAQQTGNMLPMQGNVEKANMDDRLFQNIQESNFYKSLFEYKTFEEVLEKGEDCIKYINAWGDQYTAQKRGSHLIVAAASGAAHLAGMRGWVHQYHQPSPAWCIMFKMHTLRITKEQVDVLLGHSNPHIRCLGLIYVRLVVPPSMLWEYFEDHISDKEELVMTAPPNLRHCTVSEVATNLLLEMKYLDTRFPRIAESHLRSIRTSLSKKGVDVGFSDVGLANRTRESQRDRGTGRADDERPTPAKRHRGRLDLDEPADDRKRSRVDERKDDSTRKRSNRPDLDDDDDRTWKVKEGKSDRDQDRGRDRNSDGRDRERDRNRGGERDHDTGRDKERERERDRDRDRDRDRGRDRDRDHDRGRDRDRDRDRNRDKDKDRDRDRKEKRDDDRHKDRDRSRETRRDRDREKSPAPEQDANKPKPDQLATTLAKLKSVYGDLSAGSAEASEASKSTNARKNYLGSEKITLGGRAWGS